MTKSKRRHAVRMIALLVILPGISRLALAETGISGRITDPQGKPVASAAVKLSRLDGVVVFEARSDDVGQYA